MINPLYLFWFLLVITNLTFQLLYFFNDRNNTYFWGKKITTPALLFGALSIILFSNASHASGTIIIFTLMGLGELGLEGSTLVESTERNQYDRDKERFQVALCAFLFHVSNWLLGFFLLSGNPVNSAFLISLFGIAFYLGLNFFLAKNFELDEERKFQIRSYSLSLIILLTGIISNFVSGGSLLAVAAVFLFISDTLVLIRAGGEFDKKTQNGFIAHLVFLLIILAVYYTFITLLIIRSVPVKIQ